MAGGIYKPNQGYWTRVMTAISAGLLILMGVVWLWKQIEGVKIASLEPVYVQMGSAIIVVTVFGLIGYWLVARHHRAVEFMIATEGEMKKVNWSTRREIMGMTWVVIGLTVLIAVYCRLFDTLFAYVFKLAGVLQT